MKSPLIYNIEKFHFANVQLQVGWDTVCYQKLSNMLEKSLRKVMHAVSAKNLTS